MKTRSLNMYLLKADFGPESALIEDHSLSLCGTARRLPQGAQLYIMKGTVRPPWWRSYFGIEDDLAQKSTGAIIFIPIGNRCFAATFGHTSSKLRRDAFEYDFGLRVTLNSVEKARSADIVQPATARRQRTQSPRDETLTFFDLSRNENILKGLTGRVKPDLKVWFDRPTGSDSLRVNTKLDAMELTPLCNKLIELYNSEAFKDIFPDVYKIVPIKDPQKVAELDKHLIDALKSQSPGLNLVVPDIITYRDHIWASFSGVGKGREYEDVLIDFYMEYLQERGFNLESIKVDDLKKHTLELMDDNGLNKESFSIYKSLLFDVNLPESNGTFHFCDGNWYQVDPNYMNRLRDQLDPLCIELDLPTYRDNGEDAYNRRVAAENPSYACLHQTFIGPGNSGEPCDLYRVENGDAVFYHVKISTLSKELSHLFNQGVNPIELLKSEPSCAEKLVGLISEATGRSSDETRTPIEQRRFRVVYAIITHSTKEKSEKLPLFSRISLMRAVNTLKFGEVKVHYGFVRDETPKTEGRKKKRKGKSKRLVADVDLAA